MFRSVLTEILGLSEVRPRVLTTSKQRTCQYCVPSHLWLMISKYTMHCRVKLSFLHFHTHLWSQLKQQGAPLPPSTTELLTIVAAVFLHCSIYLIHNPTEGPTSTSICHPLSVCLSASLPPSPPSLSGRRRRASE